MGIQLVTGALILAGVLVPVALCVLIPVTVCAAYWAVILEHQFLGAILALVAVAGWPRIRVESNALRYLAADHPVRAQFERLEAEGIGLATVEILIAPPGGAAFSGPAALARLDIDEPWARLEAGSATLTWLVLPRELDAAGH